MSLIDEIQLSAFAGDGGDGVVRWNQSRQNQKGGPAGGNGGRGGDVRIRGIRDVTILKQYRGNTIFRAGHGGAGGKQSLHGADGEDVVINLPVGSLITTTSGKIFELLEEGEEHIVLKGGAGGYGNEHFKSSRNVTPQESTEGKLGESDTLSVELRLIADIGLVGFPNAGKSSLLNALTNAKAKVGNYAFTTLDPNLGDLYGYIIADIPGIIEGASEGKGLGHKFLRHISRTKTLIFCISVEQEDVKEAYNALLAELTAYDEKLADIPSMIFLTKVDLVDAAGLKTLRTDLESIECDVHSVSIHDESSIKAITDVLISFLRKQ